MAGDAPYLLLVNPADLQQVERIDIGNTGIIQHLRFHPLEDDKVFFINEQHELRSVDFLSKKNEVMRTGLADVQDLVISPEGGALIYLLKGKAKILPLEEGLEQFFPTELIAQEESLTRLSISPDYQYLATGTRQGMVKVFIRTETGEWKIRPFPTHESAVTCLEFSADGKYLISGGYDGKVSVISVREEQDNQLIIPAFYDQEDWTTNTLLKPWIMAIDYWPRSNVLFTAYGNGKVRFWAFRPNWINNYLCQTSGNDQEIDTKKLWDEYIGSDLQMNDFYVPCDD